MINQYWLSYISIRTDSPSKADMQLGARIALRVIEPYLKPEFRALMVGHFDTLSAMEVPS